MRNLPTCWLSFRPLHQSGLGMVDVLVALLLLSLSLLSAGAATLRALQAGHSATLQMRAADLAADLHEDLETVQASSPQMRIAEWRQRVAATLPAAAATLTPPQPAPTTSALSVHLQWKEPADAAIEMPLPLPLPSASGP
ncbi:MAG: hypothetical protein ABIP38_00355 [Steroidobacteraceae bacterium]